MRLACKVGFHEKVETTSGKISLIICKKEKPPKGAVNRIICGQ